MNVSEIVGIMKFETLLANRARAEGMANWTPEGRAKSLAVRRAKGSVWGWDKRERHKPFGEEKDAIDRSLEELSYSAEQVRKQLAREDAGETFIGPRDKYADQIAAQRLEAFKAWLSEVKRVEVAIDQFNGIVAALGGLQSGAVLARNGKTIGRGYATAEAAKADKRVETIEKSIRRNYEKRNADHIKKYPEERETMLDMVAEKAEYYSAQPARKVEMEKAAYRQIRDSGSMNMRESPARQSQEQAAKAWRQKISELREATKEAQSVRSQLKPGETARQVEPGVWVGRDAFGNERIIGAQADYRELPKTTLPKAKTSAQKLGEDFEDALYEAQYGIPVGMGLIANRWSHEARMAALAVRRRKASERKATKESIEGAKKEEDQKEKESSAKPVESSEGTDQFEKQVSGFKEMIAKGIKPTAKNLQSQLLKDHDQKKFHEAKEALSEAWHTTSLDKFQEKFERDPRNNKEFRKFQKSIGVPIEYIGVK